MRALSLALGLVFLIGAAAAPVDNSAYAQRERREKPKTKRVETASPKVYKYFQKAYEGLETDNFVLTLEALDKVRGMKKLSAYERSVTWQLYGFVYAGQERYKLALDAFEKCVAAGGLPDAQELQTRYNLGQLYIANEQYQKGVDALESWIQDALNPGPAGYFLIANGYVSMDRYKPALQWAVQGLARMDKPRESWLALTLALYFEEKEYPKCPPLLEQLVTHFPKKQYWKQLAGLYGELGQEKKQLAAFELAYRQGLLTTNSELTQMAQLFLYHDVPYKAAVLMDKHLESGAVERSAKNWELLANSWIHSREYERSEQPLRTAASLSEDGDLYVRLAQVYFERESWNDARKSLDSAFEKGELKDPGQAYLLLGIANFNAGRSASAERAFRRARKFNKQRKSANQWLRHMQQGSAE